MPTYADWKAPEADNDLLLWPAASRIIDEARRTSRVLRRAGSLIQGTPLSDLRRDLRRYLGQGDDRLVFCTGHQSELHHPGVWVKTAVVDALARAAGGRAVHLTVDTDQPKHLELRWPGFAAPITDDPALATAHWTGQLSPATPEHLRYIEQSLASADLGHKPMVDEYLRSLRAAALEGREGEELPGAVAIAMHQLDWSLGLDYTLLTLSPLLVTLPWMTFVHHWLARADELAGHYNTALADYRREAGIDGKARPMPDLVRTSRGCEAPFWVDQLSTGHRHRCAVERREGRWMLHVPYEDDAVELDPAASADDAARGLLAFLRRHQLRIGPRALTLTTFLRLFTADVFVHGIGGGRYDRVTDRLIADAFGIDPPLFAVTTATLFLPAAAGRTRACVGCVLHEGHRLRHDVLGRQKHTLVQAIAAAPRRSQRRYELYREMHSDLQAARPHSEALKRWQDRLDGTRRAADEDKVIFDRELFYALQPRERLAGLIDQTRARARSGCSG